MKKLFKWLLLLIGVFVVGAAVLIYNPGLVKGPLERYLSDLAGYPISLQGELEIDPGRLTELTATNIHISAPDWADKQNVVSVGYLRLALVTASLFNDIVVIDDLQIYNLQLNLETRADGVRNWVSATRLSPKQNKSGKAGKDPAVVFNNVQLNDTSLRYMNGKKDLEHVFDIVSLDQHQLPDGMLQFSLDGAFNNRPVEYNGSIGPYINLLGGFDISYTGQGHFGTLNINGSGLIDDLLQPRRPRFNLEIHGPDIDEITAMLGVDDLGSGGFSLSARGEVVNDQYEASINGEIGNISLGASAMVSDLAQLNEIDLNLSINGPSLGSFTRVFGIENWPDKPFRLNGDVDRVGGTLNISGLTLGIGSTELILDALLTNFPSLDASRIKLSIMGEDVAQFRELLGVSGVATGSFDIHGSLDVSADAVELVQVEVNTSLGSAVLSGTLGAGPTYSGSKLHLHLDGHNANRLMSVFDINLLPEKPFNLDTRIETVENGMFLERGVLVTIEDERLELGGFIAFSHGAKGTDVQASLNGQHLAQMLQHRIGETRVPDMPYDLSGRIRITEEGIELENFKAGFADVELGVTGLIRLEDRLPGTSLDFQFNGGDLSKLNIFPVMGDPLEIFVPGQPYRAAGRFTVENNGWGFKSISGRIGTTELELDGLISNQPDWAGSNVRFSVKGPNLHGLLIRQDASDLELGAFESSGQIVLSDDALNINDFNFETDKAHGKINLELGWPVSSEIDASFDVDVRGDDIRHLLPRSDGFDAALAAYKIKAVGQKRGDRVFVKQFNANIGNLQVNLKGKVDDDPAVENVEITFSATSPDLSALGRLSGHRLPAMALDLKADFEGNARQFALHNLTGMLGESHLAGTLDVSLEGSKPNIKLTAKSNYIDIRPFTELQGSDDKPVTAAHPDRLIPAMPLPLEALAATDMIIDLDIAELRHRKDSIKNLDLKAELKDGRLIVPLLSLEGPQGKSMSSFSIEPTGAGKADVNVDLSAEKMVFNFSGQSQDNLHLLPAIDIEFRANGSGGNLREVAGSLNGSLYVGSEGGTLEGVNLSILDTFILDEVFSLIMPKSDNKDDLDLTCAATILKITDGLVKTDPAIAFTTSQITLVSKGTLDLKTEEINFNFNATPNNALKISAGELFNPYILVGGTLGKPNVGLDPGKVLIHGGAAIGTAGISILAKGLIDRVGTTVPLCEEMLETVQQRK
jgi:uncharacterized protein involved in outer membrane biogenesis